MTNLKDVFQNNKAFIPYVVADDPNFDTTVQSILTLADAGADAIEVGIPFSDPVADGPIVQSADLRAFKAGVNTEVVFNIIEKVHQQNDVPIILATYLNIAFKYGYDKFCQRCQQDNIAGIVILDAPVEQYDEIEPAAKKYNVALIPTVTLASEQRIPTIVQHATDLVNLTVNPGTTELTTGLAEQLTTLIKKIKRVRDVPVVINFDANAEQATTLTGIADGIMVGNPTAKLIADNSEFLQQQLTAFAKDIKDAMVVTE